MDLYIQLIYVATIIIIRAYLIHLGGKQSMKYSRTLFYGFAVLGIFLLPFFVSPQNAAAQSGPMAIEEVIVTALQRDIRLQDTPASITVFSESQIQGAGIETPADFIMLTPGVTMVNAAEYGDTQVNIRGLNGTRDAETNFALIVDGVLLTNPTALNQELLDVEQIEVLKGPQGALYGRNALAGAIVITTRKPGDETEANYRIGGGDHGLYKFSGAVGGRLNDTMSVRLGYSWRESDGQYTNDYLNLDNVDSIQSYTLSGRLVWEYSEDTTIDLRIRKSETEMPSISFNASVHLPTAAAGFGSPKLFEDVNDHEFRYQHNIVSENEQDNENLSFKMDRQIEGGSLFTLVISKNDQDNFLLADGASAAFGLYYDPNEPLNASCQQTYAARRADTPLPLPFFYGNIANDVPADNGFLPPYSPTTCDGYQYQSRNQQDLNVDVRFTSSDDWPLRLIIGLSYNDIDREVIVAQGRDLGGRIIKQPYNAPDSDSPTDLLYHDIFYNKVKAVYGQLAWDLSDELEVVLAARYDRESRDVENQVPLLDSTVPTIGRINPAYTQNPTLQSIPNRSKTFRQFQPKLTLNLRAAENFSYYASLGVGFRSGGFNSQGTAATLGQFYTGALAGQVANTGDDYDKEVTRALELGMKSTLLNGRMRINGAIFNNDVLDMQFFNFFVGPFGLLRSINNIEEAQIKGVEVDLSTALTDEISLYAAVSLMEGDIERNKNRPYTVGNEVPFMPEHTYNLGLEYDRDFGALNLNVRLDWARVGETWFGTVQGEQLPNQFTPIGFGEGDFSVTKRSPYDLVNLRATLNVNERWSVSAWGRNVTDEEYLEEVIPAPEFGGSFIHAAAGEAWGFDLLLNH